MPMLKTGLKKAGARFRRLKNRGELLFYSLPAGLRAPARRPGQNTVEFLLMLGVVAGMAAMMGVLFHKKILGGLFTMVGLIIGAGTPK
jgi:hypothetical protein